MKFKDYIIDDISSMDEIPNFNYLSEAGLSRLLNKIKDDFVIITAFRYGFDKKDNIKRNRKLRGEFNSKKMGVYQLIGHWKECQDVSINYNDCPKNQLVDVIERSYLVVKPKEMIQEDFQNIIIILLNKFDQDAAIISFNDVIYEISKFGKFTKIGLGVTLNKISRAYSQFVKKQNIPFVFECEVPGSNGGRMVMERENIKYPYCEKHELKNWVSYEI